MGTCVVRAEHRPCPWRMGPRFPASVYAGSSGSTHREHHAPGGVRVTASVPLIQGFSRRPPAFPGRPRPRAVPSGGLCQRSVVQWETDSAASCSHCLGLLLLCFSLSVKRIPQLHLQPSADSGPELLL